MTQLFGTTLRRPRVLSKRRSILALDLDCFYASVALRSRPHLAEKPVVIVQKHLCVTSNYVARSRANGAVQKMTPVSKAVAACPELVLIDGSDLTPFRQASVEVRQVIRAWLGQRVASAAGRIGASVFKCPCQGLGFDEVFIDISPLVEAEISAGGMPWSFRGHVFGVTSDDDLRRTLMVASHIAYDLRMHIKAQTRLPLCAGIGSNKLMAKLAVNMNKPDDQTTFLPDEGIDYVSRLHPRALPGLGRGFHAKIQEWALVHAPGRKIETVADILSILGDGPRGVKILAEILGSETAAKHILALCNAEDASSVNDCGDAPKSISAEDSFRSCTTMSDLCRRITTQAMRLAQRLRQDGALHSRYPRTLTISYRFRGQRFLGHSRSVPMPMEMVSVCCSRNSGAIEKAVTIVRQAALSVLRENVNVGESSPFEMTLFAVGASNFTDKGNPAAGPSTPNISTFFKHDSDRKTPRSTLSQLTTMDEERRKSTYHSKEKSVTEHAGQGTTCGTESTKCPICNNIIPTQNKELNFHIDNCLGIPPARHIAKKRRKKKTATRTVDSFFEKA